MFGQGFIKIAGDGWGRVQDLLARLPNGPFLPGDDVAYTTEIKWTNEPDGKHTKGDWDGSDFKQDGITVGETGTVVNVDGDKIDVKWKLHELFKKPYIGKYTARDLKLLPKRENKNV